MACECPAEIFADVDLLPAPTDYVARKFSGAALSDDGAWLYGIARSTILANTPHRVVRWPFPGLGSVETIAGPFTSVGNPKNCFYPALVGSDVWFIGDTSAGEYGWWSQPIAGGAPTLELTIPLPVGSAGHDFWSLVYSGGYLWSAFVDYYGGPGLSDPYQSGLIRIDPATAAVTEYVFSDGVQGAVPHLNTFADLVAADDGGLWHPCFDLSAGATDGLTRFDPGATTWVTTNVAELYSLNLAPTGENGAVRSWEQNSNENVHVLPDMSIVGDPCSPGDILSADLVPRTFVAWTSDYSTIVYKKQATDGLMSVTCTLLASIARKLRIKQRAD
jgi:hypothetical protein